LGGYLAEGAAAAFDFPALQSIAASLDLFDLRLKANDGAIQIWETLLVRYPRTPQDSATHWSIIPGAGQIYAGEAGNGLTRVGIALGGIAMVVVPSVLAAVKASRNEHISTGEGLAYAGVAVGGLVVLSIDYSLAYQDALRAVMQFNEREEMKFEDRHPDAP